MLLRQEILQEMKIQKLQTNPQTILPQEKVILQQLTVKTSLT